MGAVIGPYPAGCLTARACRPTTASSSTCRRAAPPAREVTLTAAPAAGTGPRPHARRRRPSTGGAGPSILGGDTRRGHAETRVHVGRRAAAGGSGLRRDGPPARPDPADYVRG